MNTLPNRHQAMSNIVHQTLQEAPSIQTMDELHEILCIAEYVMLNEWASSLRNCLTPNWFSPPSGPEGVIGSLHEKLIRINGTSIKHAGLCELMEAVGSNDTDPQRLSTQLPAYDPLEIADAVRESISKASSIDPEIRGICRAMLITGMTPPPDADALVIASHATRTCITAAQLASSSPHGDALLQELRERHH